jgi:hypothetical protein
MHHFSNETAFRAATCFGLLAFVGHLLPPKFDALHPDRNGYSRGLPLWCAFATAANNKMELKTIPVALCK